MGDWHKGKVRLLAAAVALAAVFAFTGCHVSVAAQGSMFSGLDRQAKSDRQELVAVAFILAGEGGEVAALKYLTARGHSADQAAQIVAEAKVAAAASKGVEK